MPRISTVKDASRIEIANGQACSLQVAFGTSIQVLSGKVWLTQEGDSRDYTIPGGVTFCVDRGGRAVLTAIGGASVVIVRKANAQRRTCVPGTVTIDSIEQIARQARASQAAYVASCFTRLLEKFMKDREHDGSEPTRMQRA
jgi:hypothetical protein